MVLAKGLGKSLWCADIAGQGARHRGPVQSSDLKDLEFLLPSLAVTGPGQICGLDLSTEVLL